MTKILPWTPADGRIDATYGYEDSLVTYRTSQVDGSKSLNPIDNVTTEILNGGYEVPSEEDIYRSPMFRPEDTWLRYTDGQIIWRRSIFTDACFESSIAAERLAPMSETMARAVAYFTKTPFDSQWCRPQVKGLPETSDLMTPWVVKDNLTLLETALKDIEDARKHTKTLIGSELANKVPDTEIQQLRAWIKERRSTPWYKDPYHWLGAAGTGAVGALVFLVVADIYGWLKGKFKGPPPGSTPGNNQDPKNPPLPPPGLHRVVLENFDECTPEGYEGYEPIAEPTPTPTPKGHGIGAEIPIGVAAYGAAAAITKTAETAGGILSTLGRIGAFASGLFFIVVPPGYFEEGRQDPSRMGA